MSWIIILHLNSNLQFDIWEMFVEEHPRMAENNNNNKTIFKFIIFSVKENMYYKILGKQLVTESQINLHHYNWGGNCALY